MHTNKTGQDEDIIYTLDNSIPVKGAPETFTYSVENKVNIGLDRNALTVHAVAVKEGWVPSKLMTLTVSRVRFT